MSAKRLAAEEKQVRSDRRAARKQANIERRWLNALAKAPKMRDDGELNDEGGDGGDDGGGDNGFFCTPPIDEKHWMLTDDDERDDNYGSDDGSFRPPPQIY